jgi:hypothetical protein
MDDNYFDIGVNRIKENMKDNYELIVRWYIYIKTIFKRSGEGYTRVCLFN